ncbi:hypothetical protein V6Z12_A09G145400 [Gossypium hirsutum]
MKSIKRKVGGAEFRSTFRSTEVMKGPKEDCLVVEWGGFF